MEKLTEIIKELIKKGIIISGVSIRNDELAYAIQGFAKSGYGTLFIEDGQMKLETRYQQIDTIYSLRDIISVAYEWDSGYCRKDDYYSSYGVGDEWRKLYEENGLETSNLN